MLQRIICALLLLLPAWPAAAQDGCGPLPPGASSRSAAGRPLAWKGDFNGDRVPDTVELVSLAAGFRPPPGVELANPWDKRPAGVSAQGEALALLVTHGASEGPCRRFLLVNPDFFRMPLWPAFVAGDPAQQAIAIASAGSRPHARWKRKVRALKGDGIVLATEAGIDILLYWKGNGYAVFWPDEEP